MKLLVAALALLVTASATAPAPTPAATRANRVLIVSLPATRWADLPLDRMPNLRALLDGAARASLTVRGAELQPTLADSAASISAGGRARATVTSAPCATEHAPERNALACPAMPSIVAENRRGRYDAQAGLLGQALAAARIPTAVVADGVMPVRGAVASTAPLALATPDGRVGGGATGSSLTRTDPTAPLGVAIDPARYAAAFRAVWSAPRAVVLLEDSELARVGALVAATGRAGATRRPAAMSRLDELLGAVLALVDLTRDAVLVIGPTHPPGDAQLTVAALAGPGTDARGMRSATTRRTGIVSIVDVAPTVLARLGVARPTAMEGTPWEASGPARDLLAAQRAFVRDNDAAVLRDVLVQPVTYAYAITATVVTFIGLLVLRSRDRAGSRVALAAVEILALALVVYPAVALLAQLLPFAEWGPVPWAVATIAVAIAGGALVAPARGARPVVAVLGITGTVVALDALSGSHLQYDNPFGYSPTVAARYTGLGNLTAALLTVAALLLGAVLASRRATRGVAVALLGAVVVVDAAPFWGADIGGILSLGPAFALAAWLWWDRPVRARTGVVAIGGTIALLTAATLVDLSRPRDRRTHLGRLVQSVRDDGWGRLGVVVRRKLDANLDQLLRSVWTWTVPLMLVALIVLAHEVRRRGGLTRLGARVPARRGALVGLAVAAVLGGVLNDSGIAVPGMMLIVLLAVVIVVLARESRGTIT